MATQAESQQLEPSLWAPILTADRIRKSVEEVDSFKSDCTEIAKQVDWISQMLRTLVRLSNSTPFLYQRPIFFIVAEVTRTLDRTLTLVRKCRRRNILRRVFTITSATDFRKIFNLLDASIGDLRWLIGILESDESSDGIVLSLPPIASTDPILSWVWSFIASIQMGQFQNRVEAAHELASLAKDNDRNKKIIVEEGGVSPLLRLLKEASPEAQIAAANALCNLCNDGERVRVIVSEQGVSVIVKVLSDSLIRVQIHVANLIAKMAEFDPIAQEDFGRENGVRGIVMLLLLFDVDDSNSKSLSEQSIDSIVNLRSKMGFSLLMNSEGSSRGGSHRKERENEKPEVVFELKTSCARALSMLVRGSLSNSKRLCETKGLLCLAKLIENEEGELQMNCMMTIAEITDAAEYNSEFKRTAFKINSPAAKAVVDQLLRLIRESNNPRLQIPAIKSIGSLARMFPARETRVIGPLVIQLSHKNHEVATEAVIALGKFASPENFLCMEHSKAIIEFNGLPPLMRLLRGTEWTQLNGLVLLCYLALHAANSEALEQARVLNALEGSDRIVAAQHPQLRELVGKAIYHLNLYHTGAHPQRSSYAM